MAFQPETSAWASGVYQWETTDPAQGGLGGVMNTPLLQLSNRTLWLKGQVDALAASISGSASLNSPAFIGNPTGPLAAQFDNDTSLATTAFVQRALGNMAGYDAYSASATLTASQAGRQIVYYGSAAGSFALPAVSGLVAGAGFRILNISGSALTVQRSGADALLGVNGATSLVLGANDSLYVVSVGNGSHWVVFGGSAQLQYSTVLENKANTSGDYPLLNVGNATSAGNADTVDGWHRDDIRAWGNLLNKPAGADIPFNWSGQPGQPAWLWGANDAGNSYVYSPSNFSVAYAASAGSATSAGYATNAGTVGGYAVSALWRNDAVSFNNAATGYYQFPPDASGRRLLIQWGPLPTAGGSMNVTFPMNFPNAILGVNLSVNSNTDDATLFCLFARNQAVAGFQAYTRGITVLGGSYFAWGY